MPPKKPPSRKGSLALVGADLLDQIRNFEQLFTVTPEKLRAITDHFVSELEKGMGK
jgi:hexokinase